MVTVLCDAWLAYTGRHHLTYDEIAKLEAAITRITECHPVERYCFDQCERTCVEYITPDNIATLIAKVKRLTIERDAAKSDLKYFAGNFCEACAYCDTPLHAFPCVKCNSMHKSLTDNHWSWRGVQEADG